MDSDVVIRFELCMAYTILAECHRIMVVIHVDKEVSGVPIHLSTGGRILYGVF